MIRVPPVLAVLLAARVVSAAAAPGPATIAITDLVARDLPVGDASVVTDLLRGMVSRCGKITLVERQQMNRIMAEHAFQKTGCTGTDCAVRLGRILNVRWVCVGSYGKFMGERYTVTLRLVAVETGEALFASQAGGLTLDELQKDMARMADVLCAFFVSDVLASQPSAPGAAPATPARFAQVGIPGQRVTARSPRRILELDRRRSARIMAFSPDGRMLAVASDDSQLSLWDPAGGQKLRAWYPHAGLIESIVFTRDGATIVTGGHDGCVKMWRLADGARTKILDVKEGDLRRKTAQAAISPDGRRLFVVHGVYSDHLSIWPIEAGETKPTPVACTGLVWAPEYSLAGDVVLVKSKNDSFLVDGRTGAIVCRPRFESDQIVDVTVAPDGKRILGGTDNGEVRVWELPANGSAESLMPMKLERALHGHTNVVNCVRWSDDSRVIASGSRDGTVRAWNAATGALLGVYPGRGTEEEWREAMAVSPDGRTVAVGCTDNAVYLWGTGLR